jgi:HSP20 family protein
LEQRSSFGRAGTQAQMNFQSAVWPWQMPQAFGMTVPLDVCEFGSEFVVRALLPGVMPDNVVVSANENTLTLKGEFVAPDWLRQAMASGQTSTAGPNPTCWIQELPVGKFARSITLPFPVDPASGQTTFDNGVLTLRLPKSQAHMMQNISVQSGPTTGSWGPSSGSR